MKASIIHKRGVSVVLFDGHLNFLHAIKLREELESFYENKKNKKIIFN